MKRLALLTASLLTAIGCSVPTQPVIDEDAAAAARAKAALEAASQTGVSRKIAIN